MKAIFKTETETVLTVTKVAEAGVEAIGGSDLKLVIRISNGNVTAEELQKAFTENDIVSIDIQNSDDNVATYAGYKYIDIISEMVRDASQDIFLKLQKTPNGIPDIPEDIPVPVEEETPTEEEASVG